MSSDILSNIAYLSDYNVQTRGPFKKVTAKRRFGFPIIQETTIIVKLPLQGWDHVARTKNLLANPAKLEELTHGLDLFARRKKLLPEESHLVYPQDVNVGESAISFYDRAWKVYADLGVLFQDDIKRLGDEKLVQAIRMYCHRRKLPAKEYLPPPRQARLEQALAEADPRSPSAALFRERMRTRKTASVAMRKRRQERKPRISG